LGVCPAIPELTETRPRALSRKKERKKAKRRGAGLLVADITDLKMPKVEWGE